MSIRSPLFQSPRPLVCVENLARLSMTRFPCLQESARPNPSPHEPYLSTVGIHNIKKTIAADIFRQDNISNYKRQTQARDDLKEQFRIRIAEINREIQSGSFSVSEALVQKLEELSLSLEKHKGKKVYGYLSKKNKDMVDNIVRVF